MSVVGIDFGSFSSYVAVARAGGIETVANEYSDRLTPSYVSLGAKNRTLGYAAKQQAVSNFKNTVCGFRGALARKLNDPLVQREINRNFKPNNVTKDSQGNVVFKLSYLGEAQDFTPSQLTGMLLNKLKFTAEANLATKVVDVVVSVPSYFTDIERRALLDSCQLAGLNCLRILNDTTAVALAYGIYKTDLPQETEKPRNVVFVDFGYSSLQVSAVAFHKGKLKMLATAHDHIGGRDFDELIVNHMIEEFKKKYKVDASSKPKAYIRLTQECEKLRKLMSANVQPIPLNIECFLDDKDVHASMKRDEFEEMAAPIFKRIEDTLQSILGNAKLKTTDIAAVEIVGGCSRTPAFKALVQKVFDKEFSTTLNADEAVARGCALQCAILSPTFRVRDFSITDCQSYPITLNWQPQGQLDEDSSLEVFTRFHPIPFSKMLTFYRKEPFSLSASYSSAKDIPHPETDIGTFKITNVMAQPTGESTKVKVKVRINSHGCFNILSANMYEKIEGQVAEEEEETKESMDVDEEAKKKDASPTDAVNGEQSASSEMDQSSSGEQQNMEESTPQEKSEEISSQESEKKASPKKTKKTVKTIDLPIETAVHQLPKDQLNLLIEKENQMVMQDRLEKERADAKNAVEEYVYEMRDKLYNAYEEYVLEDDRNSFSLKLEDTENWLYEDGEDQNKQVYIDKLAELKAVGQPIKDRYREAEEWPLARDEMGSSIQQIRKFLDLWGQKDEKYNHIEKADVDKVEKLLTEKSNWFGSRMTQMASLKPHENPIVLASQVRSEKQILDNVCLPIMNKPKPKVEPPKEEKEKKSGKKGDKDKATNQNHSEGDAPPTDAAPDAPKEPEQEMDVD
ncbi:hypothetical protein EGW08_012959 [Elysia chlorotica]|uniref:Uncharacterized protein n=1 Tax=Elysia chlorotica TaxID=188477 RepID=A0A433TCE3_ELYCH|nr:hypothetical protein EGW08_012959 [Elysia chlorotica]